MLLVFGGTTEGKIVAQLLEEKGVHYIYSTKTKTDFNPHVYGFYRFGAFTPESLHPYCLENNIKLIVHAAHPFAEQLHKTIEKVSVSLSIPVIRLERPDIVMPESNLIHFFSNYNDAMDYLLTNNISNLLALTGVQSIAVLKNYWLNNTTWFRILPGESSLALARQAGFPEENVIQSLPDAGVATLTTIIRNNNINALLTKESGESGFLLQKMTAAIQCEIPILVISKKEVSVTFIKVFNREEFMTELNLHVV